jgi:ubiquinone biosynthesis protein UbiJ
VSIPEALFGLLESTLNGYLRLDPEALGRLAPLHGRLIRLQIRGLGLGAGLDLYLVPGPKGLQLFPDYEGEPDCTLSGTPLGFARLSKGVRGSDELFKGRVEIRGDTEVSQRFGEVLAELDIDWEEQLSRLIGDLLAHKVGRGVRAGEHWGRQTAEVFTTNLKEYLQEEVRLLPTRFEAEEFTSGVERLRDDLERLEARLARLADIRRRAEQGGTGV